jgi:hypothetical protein
MSDQILIGAYANLINNDVSPLHTSANVSAKTCSSKISVLNNYNFFYSGRTGISLQRRRRRRRRWRRRRRIRRRRR